MPKFDNFESWLKEKWGNQAALAEKMGVNQNTVSSWKTGRSKVHPDMQAKLRKLGYDGPFPESRQELTQDDLNAHGQDLARVVNYSHEDLKRDIQGLGSALSQILKRLDVLEGNMKGEG